MTTILHKNIFATLEEWAPTYLAYDWDPVGLQVGSYNDRTSKIMVTLDVDEATVDEAIQHNVNLLIAHHPLLFQPIQKLDVQSVKGKMIQKLIQHQITVYAAHTNLDMAEGGVNDLLSDALDLTSTTYLVHHDEEKLLKVAVFVPKSHKNEVMKALGEAGAGHIGNYSHCTFQTEGQGTFMPLEGTNPFIGRTDTLETVDEIKIETVVNERNLPSVVQAMKNAHPYEEMAYDVYPLEYIDKTYGLGRIGDLRSAMSLQQFCDQVKAAYDLKMVRVTGNLDKTVKKVAIVGGSGEKFIHHAKRKGADVYITGDMTFHVAQEAKEMGLTVIDAGHYIEKIMKRGVREFLLTKHKGIPIITSTTSTDPFQYV